ncbi:MAG TPA: CHAD domain-containing protein [Xanthobacteraceae bacterium]|nr:CHAD domain-containing protein [Xanthobacteraceae bacterium]
MIKRPALRPHTALGETLSAIAREILNEAKLGIEDPANDTAVAVHEFRKSNKRWRAYLRLLSDHFGEGAKSLRAAAGDTARPLGGARDLRSTIDALADIRAVAIDLTERSYATILEKIQAMQAQAEASSINSGQRRAIGLTVEKWAATVSLWDFGGIEFADLASSLTKGYRRAKREIPDDWDEATIDELHRFRRRVIDHRYQMELIEPLWPKMGKLWVEEAQRLRDALGRHRDLENLRLLAAPHQPLARFRSKLEPAINLRKQAHLKDAAKIASRVFAEKPKSFQARLESLWKARSKHTA